MRISDWSSDVCSSDLPRRTDAERRDFARGEQTIVGWAGGRGRSEDESRFANIADLACDETMGCQKQDRSGREVGGLQVRSEEHTSELQSLMRSSYAVFILKKKNHTLPKHMRGMRY